MRHFSTLFLLTLSGWLWVPAFAQGQVGFQVWNADVSIGGQDIGDGPFGTFSYGIEDAAGNLLFEVGYGSADGEGVDFSRMDLAVAYTSVQGPALVGAGLRYLDADINDGSVQYIGPELTAAFRAPLAEVPLAPFVSGMLGMYLYDAEDPVTGDADGTVLGYSLGAGLSYQLDTMEVKAGYRLQTLDGSGERLGKQELDGIFLELAIGW